MKTTHSSPQLHSQSGKQRQSEVTKTLNRVYERKDSSLDKVISALQFETMKCLAQDEEEW